MFCCIPSNIWSVILISFRVRTFPNITNAWWTTKTKLTIVLQDAKEKRIKRLGCTLKNYWGVNVSILLSSFIPDELGKFLYTCARGRQENRKELVYKKNVLEKLTSGASDFTRMLQVSVKWLSFYCTKVIISRLNRCEFFITEQHRRRNNNICKSKPHKLVNKGKINRIFRIRSYILYF